MFTGGYPNEFLLVQDIKNKTMDEVPWTFFLFFSIMVILTTISIMFQLQMRSKHMEAYNYRKYDFKYRRT